MRARIGALIVAVGTSDYSYPSRYPYPYSAAIVRTELDAVEKRFLGRKPMVVVGHSMGGCISNVSPTPWIRSRPTVRL